PIRQDNETRFQRRDDLLLEPVREIRRVEQHEGQLVQRIAGFRDFDRWLHQLRSRPPRFNDAVPLYCWPLAKQSYLRRAADAVGSFDRDDLARIAVNRQIRDPVAVVAPRADDRFAAVRRAARQAVHRWSRSPDAARSASGTCAAAR